MTIWDFFPECTASVVSVRPVQIIDLVEVMLMPNVSVWVKLNKSLFFPLFEIFVSCSFLLRFHRSIQTPLLQWARTAVLGKSSSSEMPYKRTKLKLYFKLLPKRCLRLDSQVVKLAQLFALFKSSVDDCSSSGKGLTKKKASVSFISSFSKRSFSAETSRENSMAWQQSRSAALSDKEKTESFWAHFDAVITTVSAFFSFFFFKRFLPVLTCCMYLKSKIMTAFSKEQEHSYA